MNLILLSLLMGHLTIPLDDAPTQILAADLNADGRPDLITTGARGLAVVLNPGKHDWRVTARVEVAATELVAGDFTGDGHLDVATADHDTFFVHVFAGDGRGGLKKHSSARAKSTGRPHVHGLLADGRDLLFVSSGEGEVIRLINNGQGQFTPGAVTKVSTPWYPALGDLNGDGQRDLVAGSFEGHQIRAGEGTYPVQPRVFTTKLADLDGDGDLDVYACHDDVGRITILLNDGRGKFAIAPAITIDQEAYGIQAVDHDGDGRLDLVAITNKGELRVFRQTKPGVFATTPETVARGLRGYHLLAADLNGDGRPELALADPDARMIRVFHTR
jgi:hypothetical protein